MRSIAIASGKGGVGKTSLAINLGIVLSQMGKRTIVVDADVSMANVGLMLGIERAPISLHNVLMGETNIKDAIYEGPYKMKYVPSSLSTERIKKLVMERLKPGVSELELLADYVLIDCSPGLNRESEAVMLSAKEMIIVLTPDTSSLANAMKIANFARKNGVGLLGVAVNKVLGDKSDIKKDEIETMLATKVIASIPEDLEMRRATALQVPLMVKSPFSPSARAIRFLAAYLTGEKIQEGETRVKKGFLQNIMAAIGRIFGR